MRTLLAVLLVLSGVRAAAAERPALSDLGRRVPMRILVDKVMQPTRGWTTEAWMVQEAARAGFNVFSPRRGAEDLAAVRQVTAWCREAGLYHQPWMRGAEGVPQDPALSAGRRVVWANGLEQPIWSPNSEELWQWLAGYVLPYAEISAQDDTLMGVFLDFENYWPGRPGNLYELSYDDVIMKAFAADRVLALPALALDQRHAWLTEKGLLDAFRDFQIAHWRRKCRELREAVDRINPRFVFNIYPAPGTMFMLEACYPEWATATAPLLLADPWTYGRSGRYVSHDVALKNNQGIIERGLATARERGINHIYLGGIDPVVKGADPEFSGKNALLVGGMTGGYWIFYEGPVYDRDHPEYFRWFQWANERLAAGDLAAAWAPRQTEDPWGFPKIRVRGRPLPRTAPRDYPECFLRGSNALLVSGHGGQPVEVVLDVRRIGRGESPVRWSCRDTDWAVVAEGEIAAGSTGRVAFTPPADGIFILALEAGGSAYAVKSANAALGIYCDPSARFIHGVPRLYFQVPDGLGEVSVAAQGGGGIETAKVSLYDSAGAVAAAGECTEQQQRLTVKAAVAGGAGGVWSLTVERASKGVLEDSSITLGPGLPKVLSWFADEVFELEAGR